MVGQVLDARIGDSRDKPTRLEDCVNIIKTVNRCSKKNFENLNGEPEKIAIPPTVKTREKIKRFGYIWKKKTTVL